MDYFNNSKIANLKRKSDRIDIKKIFSDFSEIFLGDILRRYSNWLYSNWLPASTEQKYETDV